MILPEPAWTPSNFEYHQSIGRWSSSRLKKFRRDPFLAFSDLRSPESPSEALVIGSAINAYVLDPDGDGIYEAQVESRTPPSYGEAVRAWGHDRLVVTRKENRLARAGAASILEPQTPAAELARSLLANPDGFNEWAHQWEEPVWCPIVEGERLDTNARIRNPYGEEQVVVEWQNDGSQVLFGDGDIWTVKAMLADGWETVRSFVPCQAMLDRLTIYEDSLIYVELKSTRDPSREAFTGSAVEDGEVWERPNRGQARKLDYHCQGAFNLLALRDAAGEDVPLLCYFIAVGNTPPHAVGVYEAPPEETFITDGMKKVRSDLAHLATCLEDNTGARWRHPWELLEDGEIPKLT